MVNWDDINLVNIENNRDQYQSEEFECVGDTNSVVNENQILLKTILEELRNNKTINKNLCKYTV